MLNESGLLLKEIRQHLLTNQNQEFTFGLQAQP